MATLLHSESKRLYSWWWDSHIPKNSKWIHDNLADMDTKVKLMIKLIEEDADSFAKRAEMYYKKRPELMKLVEEFYRAYRALAERYDHVTVELRHAQKTMAEAFSNQMPFESCDDSTSVSSEPLTPEKMPPWIQSFHDLEYNNKGLKQLNELCGNNDTELEALKRALAELQAEKEALDLQYQDRLKKLSSVKTDLENARSDAEGLDDRSSEAEIEIKILKEALSRLESERDAGILQYNQSMEKISKLETLLTQAGENANGLTDCTSKAESEALDLKGEIARLNAEKEEGLALYKQCMETISALENKIRDVEESAQMLKSQSDRAENEIKELKQEILKLNEENEELNHQYQRHLEIIANLEIELSRAQDNAQRLSCEVVEGVAKLKNVEDQCAFLESSNHILMVEADSLMEKITAKDQELFNKQNELEKLQTLLQDEHFRFSELEASLRNLKVLHSQSQEDQNALALELQSQTQMLRDLELRNHLLEDEFSSVKEENQNLTEFNCSSTISLEIQQREISSLKEMKEKLEEEVARQMSLSNSLQEEIFCLKKEIDSFSERYQALMEQIKLLGFDPEFLAASVKRLQDENSKLIELCNNQGSEKDFLNEKLREMDEILRKSSVLDKSLAESNAKLEGSREKANDLQERCESLQGEKSELVAERANLLSQLKIMTENMQMLLEKNTLLENSLSGANIELEGLRSKSKCFEEFFLLLKNEKAEIVKERESLCSQMNRVEERVGGLEQKLSELEGRYFDLQKERQLSNHQVEELRASLAAEKQKRATYEQTTETRLVNLTKNVSFLREECRSRKKEFEEELDRSVNAQVEIFILQKFIEDLEQKNLSLLVECQKYVETSKLSEKLISDLKSENLEQQMEAELLFDEIDNLRGSIFKVLKALQLETDHKLAENKIAKEWIPVSRILGEINRLKYSLSRTEDEMQRLVVENSVLLSLLGQCQSDGFELETKKNILEKDLETIISQYELMKKDKQELMEMNQKLKSELVKTEHQEQEQRVELQTEHVKFERLHDSYKALEQEHSNEIKRNEDLIRTFSELKGQMCLIQEENSEIRQEAEGFEEINNGLKLKVETLEEKLRDKDREGQELIKKLGKLQEGLEEATVINRLLEHQSSGKDVVLRQKEAEFLEAEKMLNDTRNANAELCIAVEELKKEFAESKQRRETLEMQISEMSEVSGKQEEDVKKLNNLKEKLETELELLQKEIEQQRVREKHLSLELQEKSNEFRLWDSEATSFYFDLQISAVREVLLENKVQELTEVCKNLEDETVVKTTEVKQIKETTGFLECQVNELKAQLSVYELIVASLAENIKSLEKNALSLKKVPVIADCFHENEELPEGKVTQGHSSGTSGNGIVLLKEMKTRIKTIEKAVVEEKNRKVKLRRMRRSSLNGSRDRKKVEEIESEDEKISCETRQRRPRSRHGIMSEMRSGLLMKDIPLDQVGDSPFYGRSRGTSRGSNDQMLELWEESAEPETSIKSLINGKQHSYKSMNSRGMNRRSRNPSLELQSEKVVGIVDELELSKSVEETRRIQEMLVSDSRKLASLRISIREMKNKLEVSEEQGKLGSPDCARVRKQLKEMEEAIFQMVNTTEILLKEIEETRDARDIYRKVLMEKSRNGSEKIEELQYEMESIEKTVLKLEDGAKSRLKKFSESRTVILLRDIIHKGGKRTARKKKNRFCACMRSSNTED